MINMTRTQLEKWLFPKTEEITEPLHDEPISNKKFILMILRCYWTNGINGGNWTLNTINQILLALLIFPICLLAEVLDR